ncbi:MAG: hypothetical protein LBK50_02455 [Candidatus Nomurabacteria bacterium]|jgi:hypothetical protein|nr:hypothetical protein [Candidatus Nomurabacteria bacterium]
MEASNYRVEFDGFTRHHFVKKFEKQYKSHWTKTELDIVNVCERIDMMLQYKRADLIACSDCYKLVKLDFSVEGTKMSPKKSGNRCILLVNDNIRIVNILMVYSKNDVGPGQETAWWKRMVKSNFVDVAKIFGL